MTKTRVKPCAYLPPIITGLLFIEIYLFQIVFPPRIGGVQVIHALREEKRDFLCLRAHARNANKKKKDVSPAPQRVPYSENGILLTTDRLFRLSDSERLPKILPEGVLFPPRGLFITTSAVRFRSRRIASSRYTWESGEFFESVLEKKKK